MAKAVTEVAIGAAAIGLAVAMPGIGMGLAWMTLGMQNAIIGSLVSLGASSVMAGVADALKPGQGGLAVGVSTPIGPWAYAYGTQKLGGVLVFSETNSSQGTSNNKELHRVYALACHPCQIGSSFQLRIDGRQVPLQASGSGWVSYKPTQITCNIATISRSGGVVTMTLSSPLPAGTDGTTIQVRSVANGTFNGTWTVTQPNPADFTTWTYTCGGPNTSSSGGNARTTYSDYDGKIYVEFRNGNHTTTFAGLLASGTTWTANDLCLGHTLVYVRMGYDAAYFPSGIPNVSFVIQGKNDILDPRTGLRGWTNNAALCIADYLATPVSRGGFGLTIGTDIPTAGLIAAANICDETITLNTGGTARQYTCDTFFQVSMPRGTILQSLLSSCAGRITYQGGQYSIAPGAWVVPSLALTDADLVGPITWNPRFSIRDTCNAVKGTYVSPENNWQQADIPPYMQDAAHGFASDLWLAEDGNERIFHEASFPCTNTSAVAQRLAKIALLRTRHQGRGTIRCSMKAYQAVALDVITLTHPRYSWSAKPFEVIESRLVLDKSGGAPRPVVELDIAETDSTIFDWNPIEQLTPAGYRQPNNVGIRICNPPENVNAYSGPGATINGITYPSTITTGADGRVHNAIYVRWDQPNDANVVFGGHLEVQWQALGATIWNGVGKIDPSNGSVLIPNVDDGGTYEVQVRAVNVAGVPSEWVTCDTTAANTNSPINVYGIAPWYLLTNPTATEIDLQNCAAQFNQRTVLYYARTFTIPTPSVPTWYYVTIHDTQQLGESGATLPATCSTSNALVGVPGYTFLGALLALPAGSGSDAIAGGWPTPRAVITHPPGTSWPPARGTPITRPGGAI